MRIPARTALALILVLIAAATAVTLDLAGSDDAAAASTAGTISEFPLPGNVHSPLNITSGPDGNLWFTAAGTDGVGIITANGTVTVVPGLHSPAAGIALAPGGDVWLTEPGDNAVARLTATHTITEFRLPAGGQPTAITAGPDGNLWFTEAAGPGRIGRITPTGQISEFSAGLTPNSAPTAITAGPDGNLWFTEAAGPGRIGRITPTGQISEFSAGLTPNSAPTAITAGPDGNLWFTEAAGPGRIGRITPTGQISEFSAGLTPNSAPTAITAGPDGNLWFTEAAGPGRIGRITPTGQITEMATPTAGSQPVGVTAGPDGNLWFTEDGHGGRIGRLALLPGAVSPSQPPPSGSAPGAPAAVTGDARDLTAMTATITGDVDPEGAATSYQFDWGRTAQYGSRAPGAETAVGADRSTHTEIQRLTGLLPDTTYHYRLVATNCGGCAAGTSYGDDGTFTTGSLSSLPSPSGAAGSAPAPKIGRTAVADVLAGTVLVQVPGARRPRLLGGRRTIPTGSRVDAAAGIVEITTALSRTRRTQSATLWGGRFLVRQSRARGMTTFTLAATSGCPAPQPAVRRGGRMTALWRRRKPPRHSRPVSLWAKDNHGQYSTRGQNSVATVRGTYWETVNTCAGTLTFVKRGVVSVRDLRRHRTVLLHAGNSYLARS